MIVAPYGQIPGGAWPTQVGYAYGPNGTYLCPADPMYNTRGEAGLYHDTMLGLARSGGYFARRRAKKALRGLGMIPTDANIAAMRGYMPFMGGWIGTPDGSRMGGYLPPGNWDSAGAYGVNPGATAPWRQGFADATPVDVINTGAPVIDPPQQQAIDIVAALNDHNSKVFTLTVVSTLATTIAALLTAIRTSRLLKEDEKLLHEMQKHG